MKESNLAHWDSFWHEKQHVEEVYSNADRVVRNLRAVTSLKDKCILEIGAGTGRDSFPLVQHGARVIQLDYSPQSLRILQQLAVEQKLDVSIVGGDAFALPFRDGTFDVVFHQGLLEHFRKPVAQQLLKENVRVLKADGLLLVDVPQRYHVYTLAKHALMTVNRWFAGWERSFSIGELRGVVESLGLTSVHTYGEWMVPSFFYRVVRELFKKAGVALPLHPRSFAAFSNLRSSVRNVLRETALSKYTGISIGIIGRKRA